MFIPVLITDYLDVRVSLHAVRSGVDVGSAAHFDVATSEAAVH